MTALLSGSFALSIIVSPVTGGKWRRAGTVYQFPCHVGYWEVKRGEGEKLTGSCSSSGPAAVPNPVRATIYKYAYQYAIPSPRWALERSS